MRLVVPAILLFAISLAWPQEDIIPQKRLRAPAVATGSVGGESHSSYVIHADKGQILSVAIAWQHIDGNQAQFTVSESRSFFNSSPVTFGNESDDGRRWSGQVPRTGDYYIYVVAHPAAHYTLRVTVR